jgi:hypothetical protein
MIDQEAGKERTGLALNLRRVLGVVIQLARQIFPFWKMNR